eukprot:GDKI01025476.1.p1 GENE.GDKI01025476.1~~GDKI01025476.1.p1  ORF type:complete len:391 (-),score=101.88 GDKI01025476.1:337-1509(-)
MRSLPQAAPLLALLLQWLVLAATATQAVDEKANCAALAGTPSTDKCTSEHDGGEDTTTLTAERIKTAQDFNQYQAHLPVPSDLSYGLHALLADMQGLSLADLNEYRGPILARTWNGTTTRASEQVWLHTCQELYTKALHTANGTWPPPRHPPEDMLRDYTMGGRVPLLDWYMSGEVEHYNGGGGFTWGHGYIEQLKLKDKCMCAQYGLPNCDDALDKYSHLVSNRTGVVIGSETPWAEAVLLKFGARHVSTIEYMPIHTDHPQLTAYHPSQIAHTYLEGTWQSVDFVFSFSSIEHDGLGRYGDPLNPFADLESVARARCLLKPGGILFLGFGVGPDCVTWNAHRIYGRLRLFLMFEGFEVIDAVGMQWGVRDVRTLGYWRVQPVFVLRKT